MTITTKRDHDISARASSVITPGLFCGRHATMQVTLYMQTLRLSECTRPAECLGGSGIGVQICIAT